MKRFITIWLLILFVAGCANSGRQADVVGRTSDDTFARLKAEVNKKLGGSECGPVMHNEVVEGRYFEAGPPGSRCRILVAERKFFTQPEWDRDYASYTNMLNHLNQFMARSIELGKMYGPITNMAEWAAIVTNNPADFELIQHLGKLDSVCPPDWSFENIGVDVTIQETDIAYSDSEKEYKQATKNKAKIVRLLKSYHHD